jgi:hypothetical protein
MSRFPVSKSYQQNIEIILPPAKFFCEEREMKIKQLILFKLPFLIVFLRIYKIIEIVYTHLCYMSVFLYGFMCT